MAGNWLHIGGGSNLLFKGDYAGTVLHSAIRGYEVVAENEQEIEVRAGAGEVWDDFVAFSIMLSGVSVLSIAIVFWHGRDYAVLIFFALIAEQTF